MISMMMRHEIQVLLRAGHSVQEVVRLTGVSRPSVQRVRKEKPIEQVGSRPPVTLWR
ncbi:helix-turn-helix domain-containing protein [Candidatus Fermentibacteria bacterium]|nr:helix-turn-helix domain-containing protein [Candidatus Fermentibacteria bacterium]